MNDSVGVLHNFSTPPSLSTFVGVVVLESPAVELKLQPPKSYNFPLFHWDRNSGGGKTFFLRVNLLPWKFEVPTLLDYIDPAYDQLAGITNNLFTAEMVNHTNLSPLSLIILQKKCQVGGRGSHH